MSHHITLLPESSCADGGEREAGFGALETERGRLPLTALGVTARINCLLVEIEICQTFRNALDETLEATYIFPLPDRAAVTRFELQVAGRTIEGVLKERSEAREEYDIAIARGHRAAIAEENRCGVFQLRVGNLPPHEDAVVRLTLVGPLSIVEGEATFRFPLVVAPRYTPGIPLDGPSVGSGIAADTDQVPDASCVTPPVLLPGFPNPVVLTLEVEIEPANMLAGDDWLREIRSSLHSVILQAGPPCRLRLQPGERLNRDFILRFPVAHSELTTSLISSPATADRPGTFAIMVVPPARPASHKPAPRRIVFLLDRSGSMSGWKLVAARRTLGRMIDSLLDDDRFTVLAFDNCVEQLPGTDETLVAGTDHQRWQALQWLDTIEAGGGTEMGPAVATALQKLAGPSATGQPLLVLVTDGQTTGEDAVLRRFAEQPADHRPRVYALGIDRAVNAGFLRRLADVGNGVCELVESEDRLDAAMERMHRLLGAPVLTQLQLELLAGVYIDGSLAPERLPDLFADRPVMIFGRHRLDGNSWQLRLRAIDSQGQPWQRDVSAQPARCTELLASLWGRARIRDLEDACATGTSDDPELLLAKIVQVSLKSHVLSRLTAYVAVDRSATIPTSDSTVKIVQPVEFPDGWQMENVLCSPRRYVTHTFFFCESADDATPWACLGRAQPDSAVQPRKPVSAKSDGPGQLARHFNTLLKMPEAEYARAVVVDILAAAIRAGATKIVFQRQWRSVRVVFELPGTRVEHVRLAARHWQRLLDALCLLAGIDDLMPTGSQPTRFVHDDVPIELTRHDLNGRESVVLDLRESRIDV